MRLLKQALAVLATAVVIAMFVALVTPKTAHALAATMVQVVNTSASPVPSVDVNTPAEEPFQTILCKSAGSFSGDCSTPENFAVPSTTTDGLTVKRLVIENVSGECGVGGTTQIQAMAVSTFVSENTVNGETQAVALITVPPAVVPGAVMFNGPTRMYADPGATVGLLPYVSGIDLICGVFVNGHLITK